MYDLDHTQPDVGDCANLDDIYNPESEPIELTFETWMLEVNNCIAGEMMGLTSEDLPDIAYGDLYEDGYEPGEAAEEALENAGWEG